MFAAGSNFRFAKMTQRVTIWIDLEGDDRLLFHLLAKHLKCSVKKVHCIKYQKHGQALKLVVHVSIAGSLYA